MVKIALYVRVFYVIPAVALLAACAGVPPPTGLVQRAQQQLQAARAAKAADYAPTDLADAEQHVKAAQAAMAAKEYPAAQDNAEAAQVTARLAQVRSELAVARREISQRSAENVRLRQQLLAKPAASAPGGAQAAQSTTGTQAQGFTPVPDGNGSTGTDSGSTGATKEQP